MDLRPRFAARQTASRRLRKKLGSELPLSGVSMTLLSMSPGMNHHERCQTSHREIASIWRQNSIRAARTSNSRLWSDVVPLHA